MSKGVTVDTKTKTITIEGDVKIKVRTEITLTHFLTEIQSEGNNEMGGYKIIIVPTKPDTNYKGVKTFILNQKKNG